MELKNKIVTVVGLGNSGLNAASLANSLGAQVRATDAESSPAAKANAGILRKRGIAIELDGHTESFVKGSDLVILSPGVEDTSPAIIWANKFKIPIIGEMEFGSRSCKGPIIAITGTNGKSTVTTLVGRILKEAGLKSIVCGNIGNSLCGEIGRITKDTWVVLEVSSFQLERIEKFKPRIAVILNITDDHMDRYKRFSDYFNEKLKVFSNQTMGDMLILNYDAENLRPLKDAAHSRVIFYSRLVKTNGAYVSGRDMFYDGPSGNQKRMGSVDDVPLRGLFNIENVLAAGLAAMLAGADESSICNALRGFKTLPHRVETVDVIDGVEYIDDSKGTTVDSTYRALEACDKPVVLIAGGKDKNSDYGAIRSMVKDKVKALVLIGEAAANIAKELAGSTEIHRAETMDDAVKAAHGLARAGYQVLLSPMCSSFDMFKDYSQRGEVFKNTVKQLKKEIERAKA